MERLTTDKLVGEMGMYELAHNCCYIEDGKARYRDYETDIDARDFTRKLMVSYGLWQNNVGQDELSDRGLIFDDDFDEELIENLMIEPTNVEGLIAVFYRNLWAMAELRERLKPYEDLEITAEQVRQIDKAHTDLCVEFGKYTKLEQRLDNIFDGQLTLERVVEEIECNLIEPDSLHPVNAKVLTHAEAAEWEEYKRLKEQGLIPSCNVGDILYRVNPGAKEPIIEMFVTQVLIKQLRKDCTVIRIDTMDNKDLGENCYFSGDIGKRVFLSKEAAEQALKEMENANE